MSDLFESLQNEIKTADETNVVYRTKDIANYIFDEMGTKMEEKNGYGSP